MSSRSPGPVIGVAGKCCAGKDVVCNYLLERGYHDLNVDRIGHVALDFKREEVADAFGATVIAPDGSVDRAALGAIVFANTAERSRLESIVHPWMVEQVRLAVEEHRTNPGLHPGVAVNAALLFPMGLDRFCDEILWVTAPLPARIRRARQRDGITVAQLFRRLWSQRRLGPQDIGRRADMITVKNSGTVAELYRQLARIEAQRWNRTEHS